jgi:hypothetical protein
MEEAISAFVLKRNTILEILDEVKTIMYPDVKSCNELISQFSKVLHKTMSKMGPYLAGYSKSTFEYTYFNMEMDIFMRCIETYLLQNGIATEIPKVKRVKGKQPPIANVSFAPMRLTTLINKYSYDEYKTKIIVTMYKCICGEKINMMVTKSTVLCDICGHFEVLSGMYDESEKTLKSSFDPKKHFQKWWNYLLGRNDITEIKDSTLIPYLKKSIKDLNINLKLVTIEQIRTILQKGKYSNTYLKYVTLLYRTITGIEIPIISEHDRIRIENKFVKLIGHAPSNERQNRFYYLYYIYKIIDMLDVRDSTKRLMLFVHIQSDNTIHEYDKEWQKICIENKDDDFVFKPTIATDCLQYRLRNI